MAYGKMMMAKAPAKSSSKKTSFKTCPGCPTPAKCKAAGKCAKREAMKRK